MATATTVLFSVTIPKLMRRQLHGKRGHYEWLPTEINAKAIRPGQMIRRVPPNPRYKRGNDDAEKGPTAESVERASVESAYTRAPKLSVDPEAESVEFITTQAQYDENTATHQRKSKEARKMAIDNKPSKLEKLKMERSAQQRRLDRTNSEISKRLLPPMIANLDERISELEGVPLKSSA